MIEPRNTPWRQLYASVTSGTVVARRPPKRIAEIGTPAGSSHSGATDGTCDERRGEAAVRVRGGLAGLGRPVVAEPVGEVRGLVGGEAFPPDVAVVGARDVGEHGVARERGDRVRVRVETGAGRDAEHPVLGVDRVEAAVGAELHPADVVADRLGLPAGQRRHEHREVRLAARARERAGDVAHLARRVRELEDEHVLGEPALVARHHRRDAQREALLAEQRVAAVARSVRLDLARLGEVHDVLVLVVARPRHVGLTRLERHADRVDARHELAVGAEHVERGLAHARHDPHARPRRTRSR